MPALFAQSGKLAHSKFPPNACRGERSGVWGRTAPIRRSFHPLKTSRSQKSGLRKVRLPSLSRPGVLEVTKIEIRGTNKMSRAKIGILGAGFIAKVHIGNLKNDERVEIAGVV